MFAKGLLMSSLLASLVAAAPAANVKVVQSEWHTLMNVPLSNQEAEHHTTTVCPESSSTPAVPKPTHTLAPVPYPDVDLKDLANLKATKGAQMHYDEDPSPDTDSSMATIHADDSVFPIVQLENSYYIKDIDCTSTEATVVFGTKDAFTAASDDWRSHEEFVMISYDPKCGPDHDASKRDFVLVKKTTPHPDTLTIKAAVEFVDFSTAFGKDTVVKADVTKYTAPRNLTERGDISKSKDFDWNEYPTNTLSDSRFGSGFELFHSDQLTVQCVGCGTQGHLTLTGTFEWSWFSVKKAEVDLSGSMRADVSVGLIANGLSASFPIAEAQLVEIPLGAIDVPGILTIGPKITINAGASVSVEATGGLLVGATLDWPSLNAQVDVHGGSASADGFSPNVTPHDQLDGKVSATLDLSLPISIGVGVNVLSGLWEKDLAIVDTPGFTVGGAISTEETCPIEMSVGVYNNLDADILGFTTIGLASWSTDVFNTCFLDSSSTTTTGNSPPVVTSSTVGPITSTEPVVTSTPAPVTSVAPITSDAPTTSEAPVTSGTVTSDAPVTSDTTITSGTPATSEPSATSVAPGTSASSVVTADAPTSSAMPMNSTTVSSKMPLTTLVSSSGSGGGFHQSYSSGTGMSSASGIPLPSGASSVPYPANSTTVYPSGPAPGSTQIYPSGKLPIYTQSSPGASSSTVGYPVSSPPHSTSPRASGSSVYSVSQSQYISIPSMSTTASTSTSSTSSSESSHSASTKTSTYAPSSPSESGSYAQSMPPATTYAGETSSSTPSMPLPTTLSSAPYPTYSNNTSSPTLSTSSSSEASSSYSTASSSSIASYATASASTYQISSTTSSVPGYPSSTPSSYSVASSTYALPPAPSSSSSTVSEVYVPSPVPEPTYTPGPVPPIESTPVPLPEPPVEPITTASPVYPTEPAPQPEYPVEGSSGDYPAQQPADNYAVGLSE